MMTERNLWLAMHPAETPTATQAASSCDCGQDLYQRALSHCPRCGTPVDRREAQVA